MVSASNPEVMKLVADLQLWLLLVGHASIRSCIAARPESKDLGSTAAAAEIELLAIQEVWTSFIPTVILGDNVQMHHRG